MPKIAHIANLWSLVGHPTPKKEWSLERKIAAVAAAGFDGFTTALTPEHTRLAAKYKLKHLLGFISNNSGDAKQYAKAIQAQKDAGAVQINVQLDDEDTKPSVAAKNWVKMMKEADKIGGVVMSLEVHRDTCTETPEKTYEIAKLYKQATGKMIKINFDFSHFAVVKHIHPGNYSSYLLKYPKLVQNGEQSHCRPFNGHHCQVSVTHNGKLTDEVKSYLKFTEDLFRCWKSAKQNQDKTLFVCPELGPYHAGGAGYNITGLAPAWPDAAILRKELHKAWNRAK
uniref:sugar phosphate isomerase/epimerase family protein n=1 Tax=Cephaloticoccus sp. TaxID=1985742 RepID=UPI004048FAE4